MRKHRHAFVLAALFAAGAIITPAPASVAAASSPEVKARTCKPAVNVSASDRSALGAELYTDMMGAGASQSDIDAALARTYCLVRVPGTPSTPEITPMTSTGPDVSVYYPSFYYNSGGYYDVYTYYTWINDDYSQDTGCGGDKVSCNLGGADGVGVHFNMPMVMVPQVAPTFTYRGKPGGYYGARTDTSPDTYNQYGAGFMDQDTKYAWIILSGGTTFWQNDLTMYRGTVGVKVMRPVSAGCQWVQAWGAYSHTWNSTSVTGISIGVDSVGFQWNTSSNEWKVAGSASSIVKFGC